MEGASMDLVQRVCAVMMDVGNVEKDKTNSFHNYKYTSAEAVKAKVQKACARHGVMLRLTYSEESVTPQQSVMKATCSVSCDGVTWVMLGEGWGAGIDKGEKSPMKACTSSTKYALANAFCIALGDDPEDDAETDRNAERRNRSPRQREEAPISAPLASYAMGDEERARAAKQAESKPSIDEAKLTADGWVNEFKSFTHVDEVVAFLPTMIGAWDTSDKRHRGRVYKSCLAHIEKGLVEGMSTIGFVEAWGHELKVARGEFATPSTEETAA